MCAIFAWLSPRMDATQFESARVALRSVNHRGPDGGGFAWWPASGSAPVLVREPADRPSLEAASAILIGPGLLLGHRRLSIIDLSDAGCQPMQFLDRYSLVFNGEIYNYIEVREELKKLGQVFHTHSDTEVILAAYAAWGPACVHRFNGMFAFVLFDRANKIVFAARDRFGVKPLYYQIGSDGSVLFGSEIKQFRGLPGWSPTVNGQRLYDFIAWGVQDHTDETMYARVFQLQPGEMVTLSTDEAPKLTAGRLPVQKWYSIPEAARCGTIEDAAAELLELLRDSVKLRLRADVPVGSCLSGGLDSSAIVCLVSGLRRAQNITAEQMTFSSRSDVPAYDEGRYMHAVAEAVQARHNEVRLNPQVVFEALPELCRWQDEPFGSASIYAQHLVFQMAQENKIRVMLDGQGADEIFAGYGSFKSIYLASLAATGRLGALAKAFSDSRNEIPGGFVYSMRILLAGLAKRRRLDSIIGKPLGEKILNMDKLGAISKTPWLLNGRPAKTIREYSIVNLKTHLPGLLHWEDRNSMAHSVEARLPFLDYRVVEFALNTSDEFKIRAGRTKAVLRSAVDPLLPAVVAQRRDKLGFTTGEFVWQGGVLKSEYLTRMRRARETCGDLFNDYFDSVLQQFENNPAAMVYLPWRIICAQEWLTAGGLSLQ
jgi:asparagine synthase (glutamine-hydrolysing)